MPVSYHLKVCFLSSAITLTACESDTDKLQRLSQDRAVECLLVQKYREDYEAAREANKTAKKAWSSEVDTLLSQWSERNTKCELATRELNRFMR